MTIDPFSSRRRQQRRRPQIVRRALWAALLAAVFVVGIALGEALHDNPAPGGGSRTRIQTIKPVPVGRPRETVTVTVSGAP